MKRAKMTALLCFLAITVLLGGCSIFGINENEAAMTGTIPPVYTETPTTVPTEPPKHWETGYVSSMDLEAEYYNEDGVLLGTFLRGMQVDYEIASDGRYAIRFGEASVYLQEATIVADAVLSDGAEIRTNERGRHKGVVLFTAIFKIN